MTHSTFNYETYRRDSEQSRIKPLPRRLIVGDRVEVFALPGYEKIPGRYVLSQTSVTGAVGKRNFSIIRFLDSKAFKSFWGAGFELFTFDVEGSNKPVGGVIPAIAPQYWLKETALGNTQAQAIVSALMQAKLEDLCDDAFGVDRGAEQRGARLLDLLQEMPGDWWLHFPPEYYSELYRVLPKCVKNGKTHPGLFAHITREYFYPLLDKEVLPFFDLHNSDRAFRHHQLLTDKGNWRFERSMISFLTFLKGLQPGSFADFRQAYRNVYGIGVQCEFDFDFACV